MAFWPAVHCMRASTATDDSGLGSAEGFKIRGRRLDPSIRQSVDVDAGLGRSTIAIGRGTRETIVEVSFAVTVSQHKRNAAHEKKPVSGLFTDKQTCDQSIRGLVSLRTTNLKKLHFCSE